MVGWALEQTNGRAWLLLEKCSFCDISLDYGGRYDGAPAELLVDRIEEIIAETGGFHLSMKPHHPKPSKRSPMNCRKETEQFRGGGNIRFENRSPELCNQLADSGCIAISGGLSSL